MVKKRQIKAVKLGELVPGGQVMAGLELANGTCQKVFVWGGLPGEIVDLQIIKKRAGILEAIVERVITSSSFRVEPQDKAAYLSTSPWQILAWSYELEQKALLTQQIFRQQKLELALPELITDDQEYAYRNKMEFTWWWDKETEKLELANYRRGTNGKLAVDGSSLAAPVINQAAGKIRDLLNQFAVEARQLKTLLLRSDRAGQVVAQLYVTDQKLRLDLGNLASLGLIGLEIIFSDSKSPASIITKRLQSFGKLTLEDEILGRNFSYSAESFFQINLPVYELALKEIKKNLLPELPIVDLYSGVGTIGLTVAAHRPLTLIEINTSAVAEMKSNIAKSQLKNARAVLASAESVTDYITEDIQLIMDPPRAGLHQKVIDRILAVQPAKIIYLSCNPVTQARDLRCLDNAYKIQTLQVFNFFPRTPHIESLVVLGRC